ncbi:MAG: ferredoxin [Stagnimonas sp.]|nr:ferredoxin [Stagnimonas sp.]
MSTRVEVDEGLCQGHAVCTGEAPAHFRLGADGKLHIVKPEIDSADLPQLDAAVRYCPNQALRLVKS